MNRYLLVVAILLAAGSVSRVEAQVGIVSPATRVLMVGDSWTKVMLEFEVLKGVFDEKGYADVCETGKKTAIGGSKVSDWLEADRLELLKTELAAFPTIDLVHLSLGGNDFTNRWKASMSPEEEDKVFAEIAEGLRAVVDQILAQREEIEVLIAGYSYLNFDETAQAGKVPWCQHEGEESIWLQMGSPTTERLNRALARFEEHRSKLAENNPRVTFVNNLGLMQYEFGYRSKGIQPRTVPMPLGDPTIPSPPEELFGSNDCMHLSIKGYESLARRCFDEFYAERLKPEGERVVCPVIEARCGVEWGDILPEYAATSPTGDLALGDSGVLVMALTFDTASVPKDATITAAHAFLTRKRAHGNNPFVYVEQNPHTIDPWGYLHGMPMCSFVAYPPADATGTLRPKVTVGGAYFAGSLAKDGWRLRIEANPVGMKRHDFSGPTQLRLNFVQSDPNRVRDSVSFYGPEAEDPADRPVLHVYYQKK